MNYYGVFVWGLFLVGEIMCISHSFSSIYYLDSHLRLVSIVPLRSFVYILPSFSKEFKTIFWSKLSRSTGMYELCCQFISNPSFMKAWTFFFFKANGLFLSFGFKEPREWHFFLFLTDSSWLMRGAMHHQRYLILWIYIIYAKSNTGTDAFSKELLLLQEKPSSLPNTEAKSDKPSHTFIHLLSFVPCFAACLGVNDTECRSVPLVTRKSFWFWQPINHLRRHRHGSVSAHSVALTTEREPQGPCATVTRMELSLL